MRNPRQSKEVIPLATLGTLAQTVNRKKITTKEDLDMKKTIADFAKILEAPQEELYRLEEKGDMLIKYSISKNTSNIRLNYRRTRIVLDTTTTVWISAYERYDNGNPKKFIAKKKDLVKIDSFSIPLKEVTLEELEEIRKLQKTKNLAVTLFLFKEYGKYYLAELESEISFIKTKIYNDVHMCKECSHLSALPENRGGCPKVRSCRKKLEKYPFIDVGYQTIKRISFSNDGTPTWGTEIFDVIECKNFEQKKERLKSSMTMKEKIALRDSLHDYLKDFT